MAERWRLFVAVPLPDDLRRDLAATVAGWRNEESDPSAPDLRWTDAAGWHLTLAFLGPTPPATVASLTESLRSAVVEHACFDLSTGELGAFPRPAYARVIWYGVRDDGRLASLARSVRRALAVEESSAFRAHVTLARIPNAASATGWLATHRAPRGMLPVDRVVLMRSHLGRGPARYEELAAMPLPVAPSEASAHG